MKLNPDCIRDIMFYLEEHLSISSELEIEEVSVYTLEKALSYPIQELANTLFALDDAGFIEINYDFGSNRIDILNVSRITYGGYQFIESVRPEPVWNKVKSVGRHVGSFSMNTITQVATSVLTTMVNSQLNL